MYYMLSYLDGVFMAIKFKKK